LPNRAWSDVSRVYRYGFNTQEKDNEISGEGNSYTAEFWQYDGRLGRRFNLDPYIQTWISDYSVNKLNPIKHFDWKGNTWKVGTDNETKNDVNNITQKKNSKYIKIGEEGLVSLDFGKLSKEKMEKKLKKDLGLKLIKDLVDAKENYYYSTSPIFNSQGLKEKEEEFLEAGGTEIQYNFIKNNYLKNEWTSGDELDFKNSVSYINASTTTYGKTGDDIPLPTILPQKGYDGQVAIAAGEIINTYEDIIDTKTTFIHSSNVRLEIVRHELLENFYRTTTKLSYDAAHEKANETFNGNFKGTITLTRKKTK
jgi:hypothetical protein